MQSESATWILAGIVAGFNSPSILVTYAAKNVPFGFHAALPQSREARARTDTQAGDSAVVPRLSEVSQ